MKNMLLWVLFLTAGLSVYGQSGQWLKIEVQENESVWSSSSLSESIGGKEVTYGPEALFDRDPRTPWVEGVEGSGAGETLTLLTQKAVSGFTVVNGFARSERLFSRNNRLKTITVSLLAGLTAPGLVTERDYYLYFAQELPLPASVVLADSMDPQAVSLNISTEKQHDFYLQVIREFAQEHPDFFAMILDDLGIPAGEAQDAMSVRLITEVYGFFGLRITLGDVYRGSRYDDTCVSELQLQLEDFF